MSPPPPLPILVSINPISHCLFILSLTLYLSLLSIAFYPLTQIISYSLPSPILSSPILSPPLISSPKYQCRPNLPPMLPHGRVGGGWGFDNDNISNCHENTAHTNLTPILFLCSIFYLMDDGNPWVWYLPILVGSLFTTLNSSFLPLYIYIWILKI